MYRFSTLCLVLVLSWTGNARCTVFDNMMDQYLSELKASLNQVSGGCEFGTDSLGLTVQSSDLFPFPFTMAASRLHINNFCTFFRVGHVDFNADENSRLVFNFTLQTPEMNIVVPRLSLASVPPFMLNIDFGESILVISNATVSSAVSADYSGDSCSDYYDIIFDFDRVRLQTSKLQYPRFEDWLNSEKHVIAGHLRDYLNSVVNSQGEYNSFCRHLTEAIADAYIGQITNRRPPTIPPFPPRSTRPPMTTTPSITNTPPTLPPFTTASTHPPMTSTPPITNSPPTLPPSTTASTHPPMTSTSPITNSPSILPFFSTANTHPPITNRTPPSTSPHLTTKPWWHVWTTHA